MSGLGQFIAGVWRMIGAALGFDRTLLQDVVADSHADLIILTIALLAGMSLLLGQSAILFINQVSPIWFIVSVVMSGVLYVLRFTLWAAIIWLTTTKIFGVDEPLGPVLRVVGLGSAPFVFGWLILVPYLGPLIARLLYLWGALIVLDVVHNALQIALLPALISIVGSWLLVQLFASLVEKPFDAVRNQLFRQIAGVPWISSPGKNLITVATTIFTHPPEGEERP